MQKCRNFSVFAVKKMKELFSEAYNNSAFLLCCKKRIWQFIFQQFVLLYDKSEEEVSSAGEQLTSNKIYDGENNRQSLSIRGALLF